MNAGNANVGDGQRGLRTAEDMAGAAAAGLGIEPGLVGVASTGVIGVNLPRDRVLEGIGLTVDALSPAGGRDFSEAILTTDRGPKRAALELDLPDGRVRLCVQAKGAGMISPRFATMLCFVETDARVDAARLEQLLRAAVGRSFERITVDGQTSTNDSVFALASGASGVTIEPRGDSEAAWAGALETLLRQVALEIVADGEGAQRVARLLVRGSAPVAERVARSIADSPLVRCALYGGDPNWGRILAAAAQVLPPEREAALDVWVEEVQLARAGVVVDLDTATQARVDEAMRAPEVELRVDLPERGEEAELFFCDLGHDYVTVNSEYAT
jgi:glutamate N-acetyltransferase/amino-acid N-acetyltransferase